MSAIIPNGTLMLPYDHHQYFLLCQTQMLDQYDNDAYLREKLQHGLNRLTNALYERVRHSDKVSVFDFNGTYFPTGADRS